MASSSSVSPLKRVKLDDSCPMAATTVIGTHSGHFQADEAMGVWMLQQTKQYRRSKVVRTRDISILDTLDIVIDVGGVYDHSKKRYDHHQRDYNERFDDKSRCTKLSASGLVYRHYGKEILKEFYPEISHDDLDLVYTQLYDKLLEALDAIDTGVEMVLNNNELVYRDCTGLSSRVARLNPRWNEVDDENTRPDPDERFQLAVQACGQDFVSVMVGLVESELPARGLVETALLERHHKVDASGEIVCFTSGGLPWKQFIYDLERKHAVEPLIKFVLYTDESGMWRVQAVTVEGKAFENRLSLPEEWRGLRDDQLTQVTKIPGSRFVHAAGFIGGNDTYEGALKMAQTAISTDWQTVAMHGA